MPDPIQMLREDHEKVKRLFEEFERAEDDEQRQQIAEAAMRELEIHSRLEEEVFYPAVRQSDPEKEADTVNEALEEHHVVDLLINELRSMNGSDEQYKAKFTVLSENVEHHIEEEETDMLPDARKQIDDLEDVGRRMEQRKAELMREAEQPQRHNGHRRSSQSRPRTSRSRAGTSKGTKRRPTTHAGRR